MHPILFVCGPLKIYAYGMMIACAFIVGTYLAAGEARRQGLAPEKIVDIALLLVVAGVGGARLLYILENWSFYRSDPLEMIMLHKGGLSFFGGLFLSLICTALFLKIHRLPVLKILDLFAPYLALGQAIGRIGCLLNGCCYGKETSVFWAIYFPGEQIPRHPVQIYNSLGLLLIFTVLRLCQTRRRNKPLWPGQLLVFYCILYSGMRFLMEYFRGDHTPLWAGLNAFQLISLVVLVVSGSVLWTKQKLSLGR